MSNPTKKRHPIFENAIDDSHDNCELCGRHVRIGDHFSAGDYTTLCEPCAVTVDLEARDEAAATVAGDAQVRPPIRHTVKSHERRVGSKRVKVREHTRGLITSPLESEAEIDPDEPIESVTLAEEIGSDAEQPEQPIWATEPDEEDPRGVS